MGKSTSSPLSDLFIENFEQNSLASFTHRDSVLFWLCKTDDTLIAIHTDHAVSLFTRINSLHQDIKWTKEEEVDGLNHMLDVDIQRNTNSSLSFDVFCFFDAFPCIFISLILSLAFYVLIFYLLSFLSLV